MEKVSKKILIVAGGPVTKLDEFKRAAKDLGQDVVLASFSELEYFWKGKGEKFSLQVSAVDISRFDLIYIRVVGKRLEDAALLVNYAKEHGVKLVDKLYENAQLMPSSVSKAMELRYLIKGGVEIPPTYFGSLNAIREKAGSHLGFPFVIKSTSGKRARDVWSPKNKDELRGLIEELLLREKNGEKFFAQKLIQASQRVRVFVVGEKVLGALNRPTKWRKRWTKKVRGEYPEGKKETLIPVPEKYAKIAVDATKATYLDVAGVDILEE
ncbi:MAG: RimK family alpha-L-glutamate ligase, partial [Patescibacteria group bacterium]